MLHLMLALIWVLKQAWMLGWMLVWVQARKKLIWAMKCLLRLPQKNLKCHRQAV
jgi:hypothetical protein